MHWFWKALVKDNVFSDWGWVTEDDVRTWRSLIVKRVRVLGQEYLLAHFKWLIVNPKEKCLCNMYSTCNRYFWLLTVHQALCSETGI